MIISNKLGDILADVIGVVTEHHRRTEDKFNIIS